MPTITLGKVRMVWRGAYDPSTAYELMDVVTEGGATWMCWIDAGAQATGVTPSDDTGTTWIKMLGQADPDSGATADRPTTTLVGHPYFDTTLGRPVWWDGASWVDATGATV